MKAYREENIPQIGYSVLAKTQLELYILHVRSVQLSAMHSPINLTTLQDNIDFRNLVFLKYEKMCI